MAFAEDALKGDPVAAVALGLLALAVPMLVPEMRPALWPMLKSAAGLFVEAEFGAEGSIMEQLADTAIDEVLGAARTKGSDAEKKDRVRKGIDRFSRRARNRASRKAGDESDRQAICLAPPRKLPDAIPARQ